MTKHPVIIAIPSLLCMVAVPFAEARDFLSQFQPSLSIVEEYTDNLNLTATDKKDDYITTIQPGIKFSNMDQASGVEMDYVLGIVNYGKNSDLNYISHKGSLNAKMQTTEKHLNFDLKEYFIRSDNPQEREPFTTAAQNKYLEATQQARAVYWRNVIEPTVEYLFGPENRLAVTYRNNLYRTQYVGAEDSQENFINPVLSYWFNKQNGISLSYDLTYADFERSPDMVGHRASARYTRRFSDTSSIFGEYSFSRRMFESSALDYDVQEPMLGFAYATRLFMVEVAVGYYRMRAEGSSDEGFNYRGSLQNLDPRTKYQLSFQGGYTEDYFTSKNSGFNQYQRLTGSLTHMVGKYASIGCLGRISRSEYNSGEIDRTWSLSGIGSLRPLEWLMLSLEISHLNNDSNVASAVYTENSAMLIVTATY
jgi:hypothetical protein